MPALAVFGTCEEYANLPLAKRDGTTHRRRFESRPSAVECMDRWRLHYRRYDPAEIILKRCRACSGFHIHSVEPGSRAHDD